MVGLFVRLKLRLLANGLRMGAAYVTGFVLISVLGTVGALLAAVAFAASDNNTAVIGYTAMFAAWVVLPVVMSAADETLEPSRLLVFPLASGEKARGFFVAAFIGIGPAVTAIAVAGSVIGRLGARSAVAVAVVAVVAAVLQLMLCVSASRALTTTLSGVLRSRRGRDLAAGAVVLVGLLPVLANLLLGRLVKGAAPREGTARLAAVLRWTPPGMAARAIGDAQAARWPAVAGELALVVACVALLVTGWLRGLGRITVTHDASSSSSVRDGRGVLVRLGNRGRAGAVAARDLRYQWRDPRRRVLWVQVVVLMVFVLGPAARASGGLMVAGMAFVATTLAMQSAQQFGYDGAAYWMHVSATSTRADIRSDLLGKAIAASAITLPLLVAGTAIGALVTGRTGLLAIAVVVEVSAFGLGLAGSTLLSVWFPVPLPDTSRNVFGSVDPGRGCLAGLAGLGMVLSTLAIVFGAVYPLGRFAHGAVTVAVCAGLLGSAAAAGVGARVLTARIAFGRLPELLAAVTPRGG